MSKIAKVNTIALNGFIAESCTVEVQVFDEGIGIHLVGIADSATKESLLRVVTALQSDGYTIPGKKIVINVTPVVNSATDSLDLPIALGLLSASGAEELPLLENAVILGQLGLDASVRNVRGSLQAAEHCTTEFVPDGICILPTRNAVDALRTKAVIPPYGVDTLKQAVAILNGDKGVATERSSKTLILSMQKESRTKQKTTFAELMPFDDARLRAAEIAAAGGFGIICSGPEEANPGNTAVLIHALLPELTDEAKHHINQYLSYINEPYGKDDIPVPIITAPAQVINLYGTHFNPGGCVASSEGVLSIQDAEKLTSTQITALAEARQTGFITYATRTVYGKKTFHYFPSAFQPVLTVREGKDIKDTLSHSTLSLAEMKVHLGLAPFGKGREAVLRSSSEKVKDARGLSIKRNGTLAFRVPEETALHMLDGRPDSLEVLRKIVTTLGLSKTEKKNLILIARVISDLDGKEDITPEAIGEAAGYVHHIK